MELRCGSAAAAQKCRRNLFARGHKILDEYDTTHDFDALTTALEALEAEFGLPFPFKPQPRDEYDIWVEELIANDLFAN